MDLKVIELEENEEFQDTVLSLHHACMLTFTATSAFKIIENQRGVAFIKMAQPVLVSGQPIGNPELTKAPMGQPDS